MTASEKCDALSREIEYASAELKRKKEELRKLKSAYQRSTIHIRKDLFERVKQWKHLNRMSIKQIFHEALERYFDGKETPPNKYLENHERIV